MSLMEKPPQALPADTNVQADAAPDNDKLSTTGSKFSVSKTRCRLTESIAPSGLAEIELVLLTFCTGIQGQTPLSKRYIRHHC
jgi:hypothetical protein